MSEEPEQQAAAIPTRPAAGAPIASAWGGDIHDRVITPTGVIFTGPVVNNPTDFAAILINNVLAGNAGLIGNNSVVIPTHLGGLYHVEMVFDVRFPTSPSIDWWCETVDGGGSNTHFRTGGYKSAANLVFMSACGQIWLPDGGTFFNRWRGSGATSVQLTKGSAVRVGDRLA